jgi:hypothetical protein
LKHSAIPGAVFVPLDQSLARSEVFCIWRTADDSAALQAFLQQIRAA